MVAFDNGVVIGVGVITLLSAGGMLLLLEFVVGCCASVETVTFMRGALPSIVLTGPEHGVCQKKRF